MSNFSNLLREYIYRNNIKIQSLAKTSGVDRTLIQKMLTGDRIPADKEVLEKLIESLMLSPRQGRQLRESYHIARIGEDTYKRHLLVGDMLEGFCYSPNKSDIISNSTYEHSFKNEGENGIFYGSNTINQLLKAVIEAEASKKGIIKMIVQPTYQLFISLLAMIGSEYSLHVDHIFCLQEFGDQADPNTYNIDCIKNIVPLLTTDCVYTPHIYYENISCHINNASFFPYVVITGSHVVTLSKDCQTAILYQTSSFLKLYTSLFDELKTNTIPLIASIKPTLGTYEYYYYRREDSDKDFVSQGLQYSLHAQPCLPLFAPKDMVEKYINDVPQKQQLIHLHEKKICKLLKDVGTEDIFTTYFTQEGIGYFWKHGRFLELPDYLYKPLEKKDRLRLLTLYYKKCLENKVHCHLVNKEIFRFPQNLIISATKDGYISILYTPYQKDTIYYTIKETSLASSLYSYLNFLKLSCAVHSMKTTLKLLKEQIDIYTQELNEPEVV